MPKAPSRFRPNVVTPGELKQLGNLSPAQLKVQRTNKILQMQEQAEAHRLNCVILEAQLNCGVELDDQTVTTLTEQLNQGRNAVALCNAGIEALRSDGAATAAATDAAAAPVDSETEATA